MTVSAADLQTAAATLGTTAEALKDALQGHPVLKGDEVIAAKDLEPVLASLLRVDAALQAIIASLAPKTPGA